jgi:hypothetical protein
MDGLASRGRQPHPFDVLLLIASFALVAWIVLPH